MSYPATHILVCVGNKGISEKFMGEVQSLLKNKNLSIIAIENLGTKSQAKKIVLAPIDVAIPKQLKTELTAISDRHQIDLALIPEKIYANKKRLIVFDMDSTLIQTEVIDEMAVVHGIGEKVKQITERAMNGELNFDESLTARVSLLKGLNRSRMENIFSGLKLTKGTDQFVKVVRSLGHKTAIASGGFIFFVENLRQKLKIDYAFANDLEFKEDILIGKVKGEIINAQRKAEILEELAKKENIQLDQVVAIGDGANDLPMLAKAGLGVAFHAKEKVKQQANFQVNHGPMTTILYYLSIPGDHLE